MITRRQLIAAAGAMLAMGCAKPGGERNVVRVAYMGNLTHAPVMAGDVSGRLASAMGSLRLETRVVGAGPRVVEALLGGSVDIGVAGPAAIVAAHALHGPVLTIVSGVCAGGASLVLRNGIDARTLARTTLATAQIGSTQDVSLRKLLRARRLVTADRGGDVRLTQMAPALAKLEIARGALDGAWLPEPWATRIALETGAFRAIDERDLWPDGTFASAIVVARTDFIRARPDDVRRFVAAMRAEIDRADRDESREALSHATHAKWDERTWSEAWSRVRFTSDPMRAPIATFARDAHDIGALRETIDTAAMFTII